MLELCDCDMRIQKNQNLDWRTLGGIEAGKGGEGGQLRSEKWDNVSF
jgi:hypothetical protein